MKALGVLEAINQKVSEAFLKHFTFADRYYEKNELMEKLAQVKKEINQSISAELKAW